MGILEALQGGGIDDATKEAFLGNKPYITGCGGLDELYAVMRGESFQDIAEQCGGIVSVTYSPAMIQTAIQDMVDHLDGEEVGLTGLQGSGSSELLQGLFGAVTVTGGTLKVSGKECRIHSIQGAMKAGIAMLASNRKENSVIPDMSILENMYLSEQVLSARQPLISAGRERERYEKYKKLLSIKAADPKDPITSLSGGNQQKVFLARWLNTEAGILLLDNPTQGIDVGAKAEIYKLILKLADAGKTILINTLEIPELAKVADCCAVFYEGTIIKMLQHEEIDEKTVMLYSTNAAQKGES